MADYRKSLVKALLNYVELPAKQMASVSPLQLRAMASTLMGNKNDITQKDFTNYDMDQLENTINATRNIRAGQKDVNTKRFNQGAGYVDYDLMNQAGMDHSDYSLLPSAGIHNTLGQFTYKTLPNGNIQVSDEYDFLNDNPGILTKNQANSERYKNLNTLQKIGLLAKETINPYDEKGMKIVEDHTFGQFGQGVTTFPSRFGNAFIGDNGRNVNITFKPKHPLLTQEQIFENNPELKNRLIYQNNLNQPNKKTEYVE